MDFEEESNSESPAFPMSFHGIHHFGLTKREAISTQILSGLLSNIDIPFLDETKITTAVNQSVRIADKLLEKLDEEYT